MQLSKAAPAAALFYCTVAASTCQACTYSAAEVAATMSVGLAWAALAGVMVTNKQFSDAAEFLLRRSLFEHARARGIMTGECAGRWRARIGWLVLFFFGRGGGPCRLVAPAQVHTAMHLEQ